MEERVGDEPAPGFSWQHATNSFPVEPGMNGLEKEVRSEECKNALHAFVVEMVEKLVAESPYKNWVLVTLRGAWLLELHTTTKSRGPHLSSFGGFDSDSYFAGVTVDATFAFVPDVCLS